MVDEQRTFPKVRFRLDQWLRDGIDRRVGRLRELHVVSRPGQEGLRSSRPFGVQPIRPAAGDASSDNAPRDPNGNPEAGGWRAAVDPVDMLFLVATIMSALWATYNQ